jgi:hypothetical protein
LKQQSGCREETYFIAILISRLLKMTKLQIAHNGAARPMIHTSLSLERGLDAGEASAVLQDITLQRQFSLVDSLH